MTSFTKEKIAQMKTFEIHMELNHIRELLRWRQQEYRVFWKTLEDSENDSDLIESIIALQSEYDIRRKNFVMQPYELSR